MAQISRPFQIAFVAVVLAAGVWLFALQGQHQSSSPGPSASASAASPEAAAKAPAEQKAAAPTSTYHGSAPGVAGLTEAIAKANGAVATSQRNAKQLAEKSGQASSPSTSTSAAPATHATTPTTTAGAPAAATVAPAAPATRSTPAKPTVRNTLARQKLVEAELASGNVVVLLFWDRRGADDVAVQHAVRTLARSESKLVVHQALGSEVASFGSITRGVQVYGTPTLLVVGKRGHTTVITGLTDAYSIRQAIHDARSA